MRAVTWVDPDSVEHPLSTEESRLVLQGVLGHRAPPVILNETQVPRQDGGIVRSVRAGVREVSVPLLIWADEPEFLDDMAADLASALDPARGQGYLSVERDDGSQRILYCRYVGGLEGTERDPGHDTAVLVFRAHDPYWQDPVDRVHTIQHDATAATFFPFFPVVLVASELFADDLVNNDGDAEAWPAWQITGPGTDPVLRNLTTAKYAHLTGITLAEGDVLEVDTRPGQKSLRLNGVSIFSALTTDSALWPLVRGEQAVRVELSETDVTTGATLRYRRRFRGV